MKRTPTHLTAILLAVFVTFLWSTSWVLIKIGLRNELPALAFAGLRYGLAFVCLAPFVLFNESQRGILRKLSLRDWGTLTLLGFVFYTVTQGAQFLSLAYLPAVMVNLLLNLTPVIVGLAGIFLLSENPSGQQWFGISLAVVGTGLYLLPITLEGVLAFGLLVASIGVLANAGSALLGRQVNTQKHLSPLIVTFVSMGIGAALLLASGGLVQGFGNPSLGDWGIIAWLALVNTALAFTIWNHTLRTLTAVESSIINSLMMPQIAVLAVIFLGETLNTKEIWGLALVGIGVLIVQLRRRNGFRRSELPAE